MTQAGRPEYDWARTRIGDQADAVVIELTPEHVAAYARIRGEDPEAVARRTLPLVLLRIYAPLRRRELAARQGAAYPAHPTPAVRWSCDVQGMVRVGDRVRSVTRIADKYERKGRHFLVWEVRAERECDGAALLTFNYQNLWEPLRAEDRQRGMAADPRPADRQLEPQVAFGPLLHCLRNTADLVVGARLPERTWTASTPDIVAFADLLYPARADNPARAGNPHLDAEFARRHLGSITIDGNQTMDHLWRLVSDALPAGALGPDTRLDLRFPNPCREGDTVRFTAAVCAAEQDGPHRLATFQLDAFNAAGLCLASGTLKTCITAAAAKET